MARILDFYEVRWEYEPVTFPILWNTDGEVVESFSPDFYLPELDLFLEMTTLKQKLVRKKNRKLRRLRELYPDIRIKLFYARDFRAIMLKYGKLALVESLSGAIGQVVPDRAISPSESREFEAERAVVRPRPADDAGRPPATHRQVRVGRAEPQPLPARIPPDAAAATPVPPRRRSRTGSERRRRRRAAEAARLVAEAASTASPWPSPRTDTGADGQP